MHLALFALAWTLVVYLFNSAIARRFCKINLPLAGLYISTVALIGVFGEVFADTLYTAIVGQPLWLYHVLPIHNGYTSMFSVVVWGMYGFYLYLLHDNLSSYRLRTRHLALIISVEAIILEFLINASHLILFGDYFFYYLPGDLWHLTTLQAIPFYFLAGAVIVKTLRRFKSDPFFFISMNAMLVLVFVFFAS